MERNKIRKICVVTGNRSEYGRLKPVMKEIRKNPRLKMILIVTASHILDDFGRTIEMIRKDGFKIDAVSSTIAAGEDLTSMSKSVGLCTLEMPTLFNLYNPDVVLVSGDRFDILGVVISAVLMNIPVAHMEGGEVSGTIDESIRHAITKLSHIHFPATVKSAKRIVRMGEKKTLVFNVGCPASDIILSVKPSPSILKKYNMDKSKPFLLVVQHPVTTEYDFASQQIEETLKAIDDLGIQTIMLYPNVDAGSKTITRVIRTFQREHKLEHVFFYKNIQFEDYISLLSQTSCFVGNSSSGIKETCYFGTPAVNIGTRQNERERGKNVVDVKYDKNSIKKAILGSIRHGKYKPEYIYGKGDSAPKIVKILEKIRLDNIIQKTITI